MEITSIEKIRLLRARSTYDVVGHYLFNNELKEVKSKAVNGEMDTLQLSKPIGEMITKGDIPEELFQKIVLDVELGRQAVPLVYSPIYNTMVDANFPQVIDAKWAMYGTVVFLKHVEGGEVKFGSVSAESGPTARIETYAAGFEYTQDMVRYNQTWNMAMLNRAFGEAYNALLNHMHLYPIISYSYKSANKTAIVYVKADGTVGTSGDYDLTMTLKATIKKGIKDASKAGRAPTVLLAPSVDEIDLNESLGRIVTSSGKPYPAITNLTDTIYYDGWTTKVGGKTYTYAGVPTTKLYLIRPKGGFKELIKHDLQAQSNNGDLSRLVESQIVGVARRGVYAALDENVQEVTIPAV